MELLKRLAGMSLVFLILFSGSPAWGQPSGSQYVWKVGTLAPRGVGWAKQVEEIIVPALDQVTDGELFLKVFWGGVMGGDDDIIAKLRSGVLQSAGLTAQGAFAACPEFAVLQLPFLFEGYEEVDYVRDKTLPAFDKLMEKHGFRLYVWLDQDFDQIYSVNKKITTLEDFFQVRFAQWNGRVEESLLRALGADPVPVEAPEISPAVRQGRAEALMAPAIWMLGTQMHSVVRYVNTMKLRYSPAVIIVTENAWKEAPPEHTARAMGIREDLIRLFVQGTRQDNEKCLQAMIEYGIQKTPVSKGAEAAMRLRTRKVWKGLAGDLYPAELLDQIMELLQEFRAQNPGS